MWPGNNESAGKHRSTHTRSGDPWLQSALVEAAWANIRSKNCYLAVRFWRLAKRRGQQRALIAVAHTLLVIIWHMLSEGTVYTEIGVDYLARNDNPDRRRRHLVKQLEQLGYQVELTTPQPPESLPKSRKLCCTPCVWLVVFLFFPRD